MADIGSMKVTKEEFKEVALVSIRSSILGFFTGVLPGAGATMPTFLSYGMEQPNAKDISRKSLVKAVFVVLWLLNQQTMQSYEVVFIRSTTNTWYSGSGTTAIMLGALIAYGIQPGPQLVR
ncbi:tripartite tricarboxylate transporter permease [Vibrio lentus]|nr:tripartite tricarboxylate transporter permease [Vibrio lentus]